MLRQIFVYKPYKKLIKQQNKRFYNNLISSTTIKSYNINITYKQKFQHFQHRNLQITSKLHEKLFVDRENQYAYEILPKLPQIEETIKIDKFIDNWNDFQEILQRNYRQSTIEEIIKTFKLVNRFAINNNIPLSDNLFDNLVDGLMDNCEYLNDNQLYELLLIIKQYPQCDGIQSHNFYDIWCCLDDICCWKLTKWSIQQMFQFVLLWYHLNLGRLSDFTYEVIDRCIRRLKHLTKNDFLYLFFCYNICRRQTISFDIEDKLGQIIDQYDIDELGIIAMGFFKTQSKIKLETILKEMIQKVYENADTIHEITLTAILKVIRLSQYLPLINDLDLMLDRLSPEIDRFSNMTNLHLSLIGSRIQYKHDKTLEKTTIKLMKDLKNLRLKDIERILLANVTFNSQPNNFYEAIVEELQQPERQLEIVQYNNCLPAILHYLSYRNIYLYDLLDKILDDDYITELYGKSSKSTPLTLFSLDKSIDIECLNYNGNRLLPYRKYKAAKWLTEYPPNLEQTRRYTQADKLFLDCYQCLEIIMEGNRDLLRIDHILPHFSKADIILCKNRKTGEFVVPFGFQNYILGDTKYPFNLDEYQWYSIVVLIPNLTIRNTSIPLGTICMKERQLTKIGYKTILVPWTNLQLMTQQEKLDYFKSHLLL